MLKGNTVCFLCLLMSPIAGHAQESFNYQLGGAEPSSWESPANWTGGSGSFSSWPGEAPQPGTLDSANLAANHGADFSVQISTPGLSLDVLTLGTAAGEFRTTIAGTEGATLTASEIRTASSSATAHQINIDFVMPSVELELPQESTQSPIDFNGNFLNQQPVGNSFRIIDNQSSGVLTINGDVSLSNSSTPGSLLFRNGGQPTFTVINGVIDDGTAAGGRISYVRGLFQINNANTYTGETLIGANSPDVETQVEISNDLAFGHGTLTSGGGPEEATLRAIGGTRTLANNIRLARDLQFAGVHSFVLNGTIHQSNSRELINDIGPSDKSLTINGNIFASEDGTSRPWIFDGSGSTIVNGSIHDSLLDGPASASLIKNGAGSLVLNAPSQYSGNTRIDQGSLFVNNTSESATGSGSVTVESTATLGGTGTVAGIVSVESGGNLRPGNTLGLLTLGGLTLGVGGALDFELAGTGGVAGVDFDQLQINGSATLAGNLAVSLEAGITPTSSDVFTIIQAGSLSGSFANIANGNRLTTSDGIGTFVVSYDELTNLVALTDFLPTLLADFDRNGVVDADDLERWHLGYGLDDTADADGDGDSDDADFLVWQSQFGSEIGVVSASANVPEPAGVLLASVMALLTLGFLSRRLYSTRS